MDLVVRAPRLPGAGETVLGEDLLQVPGGKGANQAVAAARLGATVSFIGHVGADAFGVELRRSLVRERVEVEQLGSHPDRPTGVALIVVDSQGENLIAVGSGANLALSPGQVDTGLRSIRPEDLLLVQLETPLEAVERACRLAHQAGARVVLNAAPAARAIVGVLRQTWALIVNASEAAVLAPHRDPAAAARDLLQQGPQVVLITLGGDGLLLAGPSGQVRMPAHAVQVVDTTAAGDAFCGAFATALLEGSSTETAARFASAAAAIATTRVGAQSSLPTRAEVDAQLPRD